MADTLKKKFDEFAQLCGVQGLPGDEDVALTCFWRNSLTAFRINFDGAFMGKVTLEGDSTLPIYFLATRLLPCNALESLKKFTGSLQVPPPANAIGKAVHAFAHYSLQYTGGHMVLSDLQGSIFRHNIRPLSHTHFRHLP